MSDVAQSDQIETFDALRKASRIIEQVTVRFPISQIVAPLADTLDWLLDDVSTEEQWLKERQSFQRKFAQRWEAVARRALDENPRQVSDQALRDADYDPLSGDQPLGIELTRVFRAALGELGPVGSEAVRVLPGTERMRTFARTVHIQEGKSILPVISYAPLVDSEWRVILDGLNDVIELALLFEGALAVWLIGGFYRDIEGRLTLRPQLSLPPPHYGTRVKLIRVLLGTAYEEQCPSLLPLVRMLRATGSRPSSSLVAQTPWHRVVVQLDITTEDYELLSLSRLSDIERELARKVMYRDEEPRERHVVAGKVHEVPRPWQPPESVPAASPPPSPASGTRVLPPQPALQAASQPPAATALVQPSIAEKLRQDAEELRRKGMAVAARDPEVAQKYLLASTVLENTSVDVWLTLVDLATSAKQKEAFRREAEKVLRRQRQNR